MPWKSLRTSNLSTSASQVLAGSGVVSFVVTQPANQAFVQNVERPDPRSIPSWIDLPACIGRSLPSMQSKERFSSPMAGAVSAFGCSAVPMGAQRHVTAASRGGGLSSKKEERP